MVSLSLVHALFPDADLGRPVILGYIGWAAGSLDTDYILTETPSYNGTCWNDTLTVSMALSPKTNKLVASVV